MLVMIGCDKKEKNELMNDEIVNSEIEDTVITLSSLIHKTDKEVINELGEGKGISYQTSDGQYSREYSLYIEGEEVTTTVVFEDSLVSGIYTYLPDLDLNKWETMLTRKFGYPTKLLTSSNDNIQTVRWKVDTNIVTLLCVKNSLSIQIE